MNFDRFSICTIGDGGGALRPVESKFGEIYFKNQIAFKLSSHTLSIFFLSLSLLIYLTHFIDIAQYFFGFLHNQSSDLAFFLFLFSPFRWIDERARFKIKVLNFLSCLSQRTFTCRHHRHHYQHRTHPSPTSHRPFPSNLLAIHTHTNTHVTMKDKLRLIRLIKRTHTSHTT